MNVVLRLDPADRRLAFDGERAVSVVVPVEDARDMRAGDVVFIGEDRYRLARFSRASSIEIVLEVDE